MRADDVALVGGLCLEFPELRGLLQEHLDDYDCLLPHLFLADTSRWLVTRLLERGAADPTVASVLKRLEQRFASGDEHPVELIAVSFLEILPLDDEVGADIRELLGPTMKDHADRYLTW